MDCGVYFTAGWMKFVWGNETLRVSIPVDMKLGKMKYFSNYYWLFLLWKKKIFRNVMWKLIVAKSWCLESNVPYEQLRLFLSREMSKVNFRSEVDIFDASDNHCVVRCVEYASYLSHIRPGTNLRLWYIPEFLGILYTYVWRLHIYIHMRIFLLRMYGKMVFRAFAPRCRTASAGSRPLHYSILIARNKEAE